MKQRLPISISDFKKVIEDDYYFVDKSLLIKDIIDSGEILLITRPRRFGKTLNLSMLQYFYNCESKSKHLFEGLAIQNTGARYMNKQGKHPVIFLSFKDLKAKNWDEAYTQIIFLIREYLEQAFPFLINWEGLSFFEKEQLSVIQQGKKEPIYYINILKTLSQILHKYYKQKVVILIDEYDTPVHSAYINHYYNEMIEFMRDFLSAGFKDNVNLEKGVVTGILRVAKESIFSGFNNPDDASILTHKLSEHFGFTEIELKKMIKKQELSKEVLENIRTWYNGYVFGSTLVYNPWSIIQYIDKPQDGFKAYWVNTSDNALLKQLLFSGNANIRADLHTLLEGKSLRREVRESLVFHELERHVWAVWSILVFSGYLKAEHLEQKRRTRTYALSIPNEEVAYIYEHSVLEWLGEQNTPLIISPMLAALLNGNVEIFETYFARFVLDVFSVHDTKEPETESFYHAFFLGLLVHLQHDYIIKSNRESGLGRYDIMLVAKEAPKLGIVIEIKRPQKRKKQTISDALQLAITQMKNNKYISELEQMGVSEILKLAIGVDGKEVLVEQVE